MLLHELVETSAAVAETNARLAKVGQLAALLRRVNPAEVEIAIAFLSGEPRQGRIGIGGSAIGTQGRRPRRRRRCFNSGRWTRCSSGLRRRRPRIAG